MVRLFPVGLCGLLLTFTTAFPSAGGPRTVVSLAPSMTELVCDLGFAAHLVGRTSACDYPEAVLPVDVIGDFGRPNLEAILRVKPDLVVGTAVENPAQLRILEAAGVSVRTFPCRSWEDLMVAAQGISDALGSPERGKAWIRKMDEARQAIGREKGATLHVASRPTVFVEVWGDPLTSVGKDAFLTESIERAGGRSISAAIKGGYPHVSMEWVVEQDPDMILLLSMNQGMVSREQVARRPGWSGIRAIRNGHVVTDWNADLFLRPGPRLVEGMEILAKYLATLGTEESTVVE